MGSLLHATVRRRVALPVNQFYIRLPRLASVLRAQQGHAAYPHGFFMVMPGSSSCHVSTAGWARPQQDEPQRVGNEGYLQMDWGALKPQQPPDQNPGGRDESKCCGGFSAPRSLQLGLCKLCLCNPAGYDPLLHQAGFEPMCSRDRQGSHPRETQLKHSAACRPRGGHCPAGHACSWASRARDQTSKLPGPGMRPRARGRGVQRHVSISQKVSVPACSEEDRLSPRGRRLRQEAGCH